MSGHEPVCGQCGETWPCRAWAALRAAERRRWVEKNTCEHCGRVVDLGQMRVEVLWELMPVGPKRWRERLSVYHGRTGPCRTAARRRLRALGREDDAEGLDVILKRTWTYVSRPAHFAAV